MIIIMEGLFLSRKRVKTHDFFGYGSGGVFRPDGIPYGGFLGHREPPCGIDRFHRAVVRWPHATDGGSLAMV
jgi:hypothetical protein